MDINRAIKWAIFGVCLLGISGCTSIAVWMAPEKTPQRIYTKETKQLNQDFWDALHGGQYNQIDQLLERHKAAYLANPTDAYITSHIGFLHIWSLVERNRLKSYGASMTDHATLCRKFFAEAYKLSPDDARLLGFQAACTLAEADIHQNEAGKRQGYFMMHEAVDDWPEFNSFTAAYVLGGQPHNTDLFKEAVDLMWNNLDVCSHEDVDRKNPETVKLIPKTKTKGPKRACWNTKIAPHNFEGFFLAFGDPVVKQGKPKLAQKVYNLAKKTKDYDRWPYKHILEQRINNAQQNVTHFRREVANGRQPNHPVMMFHTEYACMACHQK